MTKRIFRATFLVALSVLLASLVLIMGMLYSYFTQVQLEQLHSETTLTAQAVNHEGMGYFEGLTVHSCRITWIAADGTVLYDSRKASDEMENHLEREEIQEALQAGRGDSTRYSSTLLERSLYAAQRLEDGSVLRLSIAQNSVLTLVLGMLQPICVILSIAIILSGILASRLAKKIVKPLNELNLDDPLSNGEYGELSPLLRRINSQQCQLRSQARELKRKQRQFDAVTGNMSEGLVLLDNKGTILSINTAAIRLLDAGMDCVGRDFLTVNRSPVVCDLLYQALDGRKAERVISLPAGEYQFDASPVRSDGQVSGVVMLLFDVTEARKAEALRREFTANVSHELKTPLHAISGYAELLKSGLVREGDVKGFSEKIYSETQRLVRLVEDILRLSRLDEGSADLQWAQTDLYALARETVANLTAAAELAQVTLVLEGESAPLRSIPQLLGAILFNLTDNAIKYNHPGGRVTVCVTATRTDLRLTVADTGIGIPPEHRDRIFERFYRVDKSHSKEVGGTGLGLSIVKHACLILGASVEVDSTLGQGTTVTVAFPQ